MDMGQGFRPATLLYCKVNGGVSHVSSRFWSNRPPVGRVMSLYYTPNVHQPHPSREDPDDDPLRDDQSSFRLQQRPSITREDGARQRRHETPLNDDADTGSIFIFPQPPSSTSPISSTSCSLPRSPYSEYSVISRPAHRRRATETPRISYSSQSGSSPDIDDISTPTTTKTLSIGSSPVSAFTDVHEDEGSEEGRIEAMLWGWDDGVDEGVVDGPGGELRGTRGDVRPGEVLRANLARGTQVRPWPLQHGSGERLLALIEREQLRDRWRNAALSQHTRQSRSRSYSPLTTPSSRSELDLLSLAPHPKIGFPFLDFFASILGVEESTVDLLTHCSTVETHGSVLFPGHTIQPLPAPPSHLITGDEFDDLSSTFVPADKEADSGTGVHGFHKALLSPGMERDSWASLKGGLTVFYNTAASVPARNTGRLLGLVQLWELVSHGCAKGGNVVKRVYSSTRTSPSRTQGVK